MYKWMLVTILITSLSACDNSSVSYYQEHIEQAKSIAQQCDNRYARALTEQNTQQLETILADEHCQNAKVALGVIPDTESLQRKAAFDLAVNAALNKQKPLAFNEFIDIQRKCAQTTKNTAKIPQCVANNTLLDKKMNDELRRILQTTPKDMLVQQKHIICSENAQSKHCDVNARALTTLQKEQINFYTANDNILVHDYNNCFNQYKSIEVESGLEEARKLLQRSFICSTAILGAKQNHNRHGGYNFPLSTAE